VYSVDVEGDRSLTMHHYRQNNVPLNDDSSEVLKHLRTLWGFDVYLHSLGDDGKVIKSYSCAERNHSGDQLELDANQLII